MEMTEEEAESIKTASLSGGREHWMRLAASNPLPYEVPENIAAAKLFLAIRRELRGDDK